MYSTFFDVSMWFYAVMGYSMLKIKIPGSKSVSPPQKGNDRLYKPVVTSTKLPVLALFMGLWRQRLQMGVIFELYTGYRMEICTYCLPFWGGVCKVTCMRPKFHFLIVFNPQKLYQQPPKLATQFWGLQLSPIPVWPISGTTESNQGFFWGSQIQFCYWKGGCTSNFKNRGKTPNPWLPGGCRSNFDPTTITRAVSVTLACNSYNFTFLNNLFSTIKLIYCTSQADIILPIIVIQTFISPAKTILHNIFSSNCSLNYLCSPFYDLDILFLCYDHIANVDKRLASSINPYKPKHRSLTKPTKLSQTIKICSESWISTNLESVAGGFLKHPHTTTHTGDLKASQSSFFPPWKKSHSRCTQICPGYWFDCLPLNFLKLQRKIICPQLESYLHPSAQWGHCDFIIAKGFFYLGGGYKRVVVELQRISTELRTMFTINEAKLVHNLQPTNNRFFEILSMISFIIMVIYILSFWLQKSIISASFSIFMRMIWNMVCVSYHKQGMKPLFVILPWNPSGGLYDGYQLVYHLKIGKARDMRMVLVLVWMNILFGTKYSLGKPNLFLCFNHLIQLCNLGLSELVGANSLFFSSLEDEPLLLPLSPKPVFEFAKATVSSFLLCVCLNDRDETRLQLLPCHHNSVQNHNMLYIIKLISSLGYSSKHFDCMIAKFFFILVKGYIRVKLQRISTELRTNFTKNQAQILHNLHPKHKGYQLSISPSSEKALACECTVDNQNEKIHPELLELTLEIIENRKKKEENQEQEDNEEKNICSVVDSMDVVEKDSSVMKHMEIVEKDSSVFWMKMAINLWNLG
ncbi:hypothetical protein VP01_3754g1 [Puccinia sorghi]|uniref:Uncharacterized protein n=1 Tax=Puccinia sorghi TaxID=27349 RepID=A0A0L6UUM6_9BASI|nr:hypothetical protein VP01_3754g1 [Puccinia sorghi]